MVDSVRNYLDKESIEKEQEARPQNGVGPVGGRAAKTWLLTDQIGGGCQVAGEDTSVGTGCDGNGIYEVQNLLYG